MLTFEEANLFLRAGDDMRFAQWPHGDFIRMVEGLPRVVVGYAIERYIPSSAEQIQPLWRRA